MDTKKYRVEMDRRRRYRKTNRRIDERLKDAKNRLRTRLNGYGRRQQRTLIKPACDTYKTFANFA